MIEDDDYFNQDAYKKGDETNEFYNGPATEEPMLSDIIATDYDGCYYFTYIYFTISGGVSPSGTIRIIGKDRWGEAQEEVVTITSNGEKGTIESEHWSEIESITSSGLSDETPVPNVVIRIWNQAEEWVTTFSWSPFKCRWEENPVIKPSGGGWDYSDGKVFTKEPIEIDDIIKYNGTEVTVLDVRIHRDLDGEEVYRTVVY